MYAQSVRTQITDLNTDLAMAQSLLGKTYPIKGTISMQIKNQDLQQLKQRELEFLELVENCNHAELAKCTKFLAMYIALYRQQFGEIPSADYLKLLQPTTLDKDLIQIIGDGMREASEMMKTVLMQGRSQDNVPDTKWVN